VLPGRRFSLGQCAIMITEEDVTLDTHAGTLSGTLCLPGDRKARTVVLMVHGTGPLDRDENMAGQHLDIFNSIARFLAARGIASVRYDKRGCGRSAGDYHRAGHSDLVDDAVCWVDAMAKPDFCGSARVIVLGHSEGSIIAPQVSAVRRSVNGLILLCPFLEDVESILIRQAAQIEQECRTATGFRATMRSFWLQLNGVSVTGQKKLIRKIKCSEKDTFRIGFQRVPARSLREMMQLDPRAILANVSCPTLLLGGEKDLQCDPADISRIAGLVKAPVEAHVIPDLTHVLRKTDLPPSILGSTELLREPMDSAVPEFIASWLTRLPGNSANAERS
jgi:uncharacterized protein